MLNRLAKRWCTAECLPGCLEEEKRIEAQLREFLEMSGLDFTLARDDDGIVLGVESRSLADSFRIVHVRNQIRVEHDRIVKGSSERHAFEHLFRSLTEVIGYLTKNLPMD